MVERADLEAQYRAILELERRRSECPLLFAGRLVAGHARQQEFVAAGKRPGIKIRVALGGNRSGKTYIGSLEALAHAYGYRHYEVPDLKLTPEGDLPHRDSIPPQYWCRRPDGIPIQVPSVGMCVTGLARLRGIGANVFPALHEALPLEVRRGKGLKILKGAQGVPDWLELPNGSKIYFAEQTQELATFEGFRLDWVWVDECISMSLWNALITRLFDRNGPIWATLTPLEARSAWMVNLRDNPPANTVVVRMSIDSNPAWTTEKIEAWKNSAEFDEREMAARYYGDFPGLADRVFDRFDPAVHVIRAFAPSKDWIHGVTVDPHHRRPPFMVWWAYDPATATYHFYREFPADREFHKARAGGLTPAETAHTIRQLEGPLIARFRLCDPRFGKAEHTRHGFQEAAWVDLMAQQGLYFDAQIPNIGDIERGHAAVNALLGYDKRYPLSPTNRPKLYVHEGCPNLIASFLRYAYLDVQDAVKGLYRKVSEEFKDPVDCVRYTVLWPLPATEAEVASFQQGAERRLTDAGSGPWLGAADY